MRRLLGTRKVGHAGTLDPMATGVLVLGVNRATRLLGHLALHDKRYLATVRLGQTTDTDDADGDLVAAADATSISRADIGTVIATLRGDIQQVPSTVSASKVAGKRAYALAREGKTVELAARAVTVSRFDVLDERRGDCLIDLDVDVECSSGTYVRALARDLGATLGVGGHLTALRRTRTGPFELSSGFGADLEGEQTPVLMPMGQAARLAFPTITVDDATATDVSFGRRLAAPVPAAVTAIVDAQDELLALYRPDGDGARPIAVFVG